MSMNAAFSVVAVGDDMSLTRMGDVTSLEAAVALYDRTQEEHTWPEESSLWAVGCREIFSYEPDVDAWISLEGLAADVIINMVRPVIN